MVAVTAATDAAIDAHLARLGAAECRAFVADLWAARGFETRLESDTVVATRRGDSLVLFPTVGGRLQPPPSPDGPVDVVVAPRGGSAAAALAADHDARLVVASDLREMLRYAVDPVDGDALCERHLGAPASALRPPVTARLRAHAEGLAGGDASVGTTALVAVLALAVVATGAFGAVDLSAGPGAAEASVGVEESPPAAVDTEAGPTTDEPTDTARSRELAAPTPATDLPAVRAPGVDRTGVTNLSALAAAHDRALGDRSYTLWLDSYRPANGVPNEPRRQRDTDIAVAGDRYVATESVEDVAGDGDRRLAREVYYDGTDWYVNNRFTADPIIRWVDGSEVETSVQPDPRSLRTSLVTRYLATPTTAVTGHTHQGNTVWYRLEGAGTPPGLGVAEVHNYTVVASVDERGFVREATVEFTVVTTMGSYRLRFEWTYGRLGATTVTTPARVEEAREPAAGSGEGTANRSAAAS